MTAFILAQRDPMNEKSTYPPYNSTVFFRSGELLNNILPFWTQFFLNIYHRSAVVFQGNKKQCPYKGLQAVSLQVSHTAQVFIRIAKEKREEHDQLTRKAYNGEMTSRR